MSAITSSCSSIEHSSNLENFLHSVTPVIKHAFVPLNDNKKVEANSGLKNKDIKLHDIWEVYDEWSCCGVGIPVILESGESIIQYYVPYLSAIQIYIKKSTSTYSHHDHNNHDDDDDASTQSNDKNLKSDNSCCTGDHDHLYVQFYESCSPYLRVPFLDKIIELAQSYPGLLTFYINDISPASWMSIAWYPIYHIPASIYSNKELCTCFLTFHALSCPFQAYNNDEGDHESGQVLDLVPFGLATYKMQSHVWNNRDKGDDEKIKDLETAASSWLKQLHIQHHDFIFFTQ